MNAISQVGVRLISSRYFWPAVLTTSSYLIPRLFWKYYPKNDAEFSAEALRARARRVSGDPEGAAFSFAITESIFIPIAIFSLAYNLDSGYSRENSSRKIVNLAIYCLAISPLFHVMRAETAIGIYKFSYWCSAYPKIDRMLKSLASIIITRDREIDLVERAEADIDEKAIENLADLHRLKIDWAQIEPAIAPANADEVLRLYQCCQRENLPVPALCDDASAADIKDFIDRAQRALKESFEDWYSSHSSTAYPVQFEFKYPRIPDEHFHNLIFSLFIDPITKKPIRFPVTIEDQLGGADIHFERESIVDWLYTSNINPVNNQPLRLQDLRENDDLRYIIETEMKRLNIL